LIELLTVIAIIAILASLTVVVGPRIIERSKWTHFKTTCNQLRTSFTAYATKDPIKTKITYPPAYGYRVSAAKSEETGQYIPFFYKPYLAMIPGSEFGNTGYDDVFVKGTYDTDRDGKISLLEFLPMGTRLPGGGYVFATAGEQPLYNGQNLQNDVAKMMTADRPYVYIPVDSTQAQKARMYWQARVAQVPGRELEGGNALHWLPDETFPASIVRAGEANNPISSLAGKFPPQKYDDFVLITAGPVRSTGKILTAPDSFMNDIASLPLSDQYHILALRAFFLATRDMDDDEHQPGMDMLGNGKFDFDYRNRTRGTDGKPDSYQVPGLYKLPDGTGGYGPGIYQGNYPDGA
jgi:hypothetical protein